MRSKKKSFEGVLLCKSMVVFAVFLLSVANCFAQPSVFKADPDAAKLFFNNHNYFSAIKVYQLLLKKEPENVEYNQMIAKCYMLSNSIKSKAIPPLEFLIKQEKFPDDTWLDLGRAYHFSNRFDDAIAAYNKYKEKVGGDKRALAAADRYIEQAHNGKELIKFPLKVAFENMGKNINSEFPDFYPIVSSDGLVLYFTSRRKSPTSLKAEFDGLFPSDVFYCNQKGGKWEKAQTIGNAINTNLDEQVVDVSEDGTIMLFYIDHIDVFGDIWIVRRLNNKMAWLKAEPLQETLNSGLETSASIFKDPITEEESILISSSRLGSASNPNYGETDIYISKKLPTGKWSDPKNLGSNINTKYKEEFPQFSQDGKTLYFASEGHSSMGGFDLFKSVWDESDQSWSAPKNLGYPINSAGDDINISFTSEGRIGYLSALREGGQGDLDIYRIILQDIEPKESIFRGYVSSVDTLKKISDVKIEVYNALSNDLFATYTPDRNNFYFIMALLPGKWIMNVSADGFETYTEEINIFEEVLKFCPEVNKNIKLTKK
jgi:tetratricopeptide (TPR) repeat protein